MTTNRLKIFAKVRTTAAGDGIDAFAAFIGTPISLVAEIMGRRYLYGLEEAQRRYT